MSGRLCGTAIALLNKMTAIEAPGVASGDAPAAWDAPKAVLESLCWSSSRRAELGASMWVDSTNVLSKETVSADVLSRGHPDCRPRPSSSGGHRSVREGRLVAKLAAARKRKRVANGKCEGRKSLAETNPEAVALAKALSRKRPKGGQMSLQAVSAEMAARGFLNERGAPFNHKSVATMLAA